MHFISTFVRKQKGGPTTALLIVIHRAPIRYTHHMFAEPTDWHCMPHYRRILSARHICFRCHRQRCHRQNYCRSLTNNEEVNVVSYDWHNTCHVSNESELDTHTHTQTLTWRRHQGTTDTMQIKTEHVCCSSSWFFVAVHARSIDYLISFFVCHWN